MVSFKTWDIVAFSEQSVYFRCNVNTSAPTLQWWHWSLSYTLHEHGFWVYDSSEELKGGNVVTYDKIDYEVVFKTNKNKKCLEAFIYNWTHAM